MPTPDFTLLYVDDPTASAAFYAALFGRPPVEASPGFAMFVLDRGIKLGLWKREAVLPKASATPGGAEMVMAVESAEVVDATHADWAARGLTIAQEPTTMDFGRTFVATDPDGHRLRVYCPGEQVAA